MGWGGSVHCAQYTGALSIGFLINHSDVHLLELLTTRESFSHFALFRKL